MNKVNIANYTIYDLANKFNTAECYNIDNNIVGLIADNWHKKHFIGGVNKEVKNRKDNYIKQNFLI